MIISSDEIIELPNSNKNVRKIVIKPNLGYPKPHPVTTRVELIKRVVDQVLAVNQSAEIHIVEGVCTKVKWLEVMKKVGILAYFQPNDSGVFLSAQHVNWKGRVFLSDADQLPCESFTNPKKAFKYSEIQAPSILKEADFCISMAPLKKTMLNESALFSGTVKNLFGLLPRKVYKARSPNSRGKLHRPNVHEVICDVYNCLRPYFHFGILDMHSYYESPDWKPDRRNSLDIGKVVFGKDLLEVDLEGLPIINEIPCAYQVNLGE